jgi:hypothetical protein
MSKPLHDSPPLCPRLPCAAVVEVLSDGEDAELLDYLVEEEKGRLYRRASLCHLGSVQLNPFSCTETADPIRIYELAPLHRHSH